MYEGERGLIDLARILALVQVRNGECPELRRQGLATFTS